MYIYHIVYMIRRLRNFEEMRRSQLYTGNEPVKIA